MTAASDNRPNRTQYTGNDEWYTPAKYVEMAREVMGGIDVDPASNEIAQATVRAATYYTAETDGLQHQWRGSVWMNPPYSRALIGRFISKLVAEFSAGRVTEAIVLTNNSTDTSWAAALAREGAAVCFPKGRIRFLTPEGKLGKAPQGQMFNYLGPHQDRFSAVFGTLGFVIFPMVARAA